MVREAYWVQEWIFSCPCCGQRHGPKEDSESGLKEADIYCLNCLEHACMDSIEQDKLLGICGQCRLIFSLPIEMEDCPDSERHSYCAVGAPSTEDWLPYECVSCLESICVCFRPTVPGCGSSL